MEGFLGFAGEVDVLEDAYREGLNITHSDLEEDRFVLYLT